MKVPCGGFGKLLYKCLIQTLPSQLTSSRHQKKLPMFATRAMKRDFVHRFQTITSVSPTFLLEMCYCDVDLVFDLRQLNKGHKTKYDEFWNVASTYIEEQSLQDVQSRQHELVCYSALAISAGDFIDQVKRKLSDDAAIPSEDCVRFQFVPSNP